MGYIHDSQAKKSTFQINTSLEPSLKPTPQVNAVQTRNIDQKKGHILRSSAITTPQRETAIKPKINTITELKERKQGFYHRHIKPDNNIPTVKQAFHSNQLRAKQINNVIGDHINRDTSSSDIDMFQRKNPQNFTTQPRSYRNIQRSLRSPIAAQQNLQHPASETSSTSEREVSIQMKAELPGNSQVTSEESRPNKTGLPDRLKTGIENLSGYLMDNVKVHYNSPKPAQLQANAYAQGTDIHIAPGQEKHLPHEAWHIVQQKQGRVKPTIQMENGISVNYDKGLEKEADVMGTKSLQMNSSLNKSNPIINSNGEIQNTFQLEVNADRNLQVVQRNPRAILGKKLMSGIFSSTNPFARSVFKGMNAAMWVEGQPLTAKHQEVLEKSLLEKQNGILDTLIAENPHVMKTEGNTPIYLMGKYLVHHPLQWYLKNAK